MAYYDQSVADFKRCLVLYSGPNLIKEGYDLNSGSGQKVSVWSNRYNNWRLQKEA